MGGPKFSKNPRQINLTRAINLGNQTVCPRPRVEAIGPRPPSKPPSRLPSASTVVWELIMHN